MRRGPVQPARAHHGHHDAQDLLHSPLRLPCARPPARRVGRRRLPFSLFFRAPARSGHVVTVVASAALALA
eukprot:476852-Prymnesium_polylepis.1